MILSYTALAGHAHSNPSVAMDVCFQLQVRFMLHFFSTVSLETRISLAAGSFMPGAVHQARYPGAVVAHLQILKGRKQTPNLAFTIHTSYTGTVPRVFSHSGC